MNEYLELLLTAANDQCRKKLSADERYARLEAESKDLWSQFCRRYPKEVRRAALDVINLDGEISDLEAQCSFLLGLQIGVEVGRLDMLPRE